MELNSIQNKAKTYGVPIIRTKSHKILEKITTEKQPLHILEIGMAVGFSGITMLSACEGDLVTIEHNKDFIKQAKKKVPDLILLDYEMPEWDGRRTLEEIRNDEDLKDIPVVFLTAVADKAHISAVLKLYPSGYLLKPIEQQKLLDTIEKVLGGVV